MSSDEEEGNADPINSDDSMNTANTATPAKTKSKAKVGAPEAIRKKPLVRLSSAVRDFVFFVADLFARMIIV